MKPYVLEKLIDRYDNRVIDVLEDLSADELDRFGQARDPVSGQYVDFADFLSRVLEGGQPEATCLIDYLALTIESYEPEEFADYLIDAALDL